MAEQVRQSRRGVLAGLLGLFAASGSATAGGSEQRDEESTRRVGEETDAATVHQGTFAVDRYNTASLDTNHVPRSADDVERDWEYDVGSSPDDLIRTAPAVTDDTVVFGANNNNVYALDVSDGSEQWVTDVGTDVRGSPAIADGTVYVGAGPAMEHPDGHLYALDLDSGEVEWEFEPNNLGAGKYEAVWAAPTVVDDTVYVGPKTGYMTALDAADGSLRWEEYMYGWIEAAPAVTDDTVYVPVGSGEGAVVALDRDDGTEQWRYHVPGAYSQVDAAPTVHRGRVVVGATVWPEGEDSSWPELFCLDAESGDLEWRLESSGGFDHTVAVRDETIYVLSDALYALDLADGSEQWEADTSGGAAPLVVGDVVLTGSDPTAAVDADTGDVLWTVDAGGGNHPAVGPDRIYVPDFHGQFTAYAIQSSSPATYADDDGVVRTGGLREAIGDWRGGDIETTLLREVIDAWRSRDPVD